ncbi:hypothetical protein BN946_scf184751.g3 [Trametes cinnabarina]|uniref:Uncharacterized protein n=1 Tax=Pycnoporus cinnabarinus TaxID=5643 RepID=A0A060SQ99_PYCCI|nr:hypothetical protein BN946_scf184751.g3 [Trametes cinnabarina]
MMSSINIAGDAHKQGDMESTQALDNEFLHVDFLKHAFTLATKGTRPTDPYTSDLVTTLLDLAKLSARIACKLTWDNISHESSGLLNARKDLHHSYTHACNQLERAIGASTRGHKLPTHSEPAAPPMISELDLEVSLAAALEKSLKSELVFKLQDLLTQALKEPLLQLLHHQLERDLQVRSLKRPVWTNSFASGGSAAAKHACISELPWERHYLPGPMDTGSVQDEESDKVL